MNRELMEEGFIAGLEICSTALEKVALSDGAKAGIAQVVGGPIASGLGGAAMAPKGSKIDAGGNTAFQGTLGGVIGGLGGATAGAIGGAALGAGVGALKHYTSDKKTKGFFKKKSLLGDRIGKGALAGAMAGGYAGVPIGSVVGGYKGAKGGYESKVAKKK